MIFSSHEFLLNLVGLLAGFRVLGWLCADTKHSVLAIWFLAGSSIYLYACWGWADLVVIAVSLSWNFLAGRWLGSPKNSARRAVAIIAITGNLLMLGYFKYGNFLLENIGRVWGPVPQLEVFLPLGISFYTFQQIAYVIDSYQGETGRYRFVDYISFVTFFPQLIAGPIVSHRTIMPQLRENLWRKTTWLTFGQALVFFSIGLFKKTFLADQLAPMVDAGYGAVGSLSMPEAWIVTFGYTCQLYFDFSGYCDMAVGLGLFFGIRLPVNFNSPYRAESVQGYWARWNITLGVFFRDYLFRALGGFSRQRWRRNLSVFLLMTLIGAWHGASWMFVLFGAVHGLSLVIQRWWREQKRPLPHGAAVALTFAFVHLSLVLFRSVDLAQALEMYGNLFGGELTWPASLHSLVAWTGWFEPRDWLQSFDGPKEFLLVLLGFGLGLIFLGRNLNHILEADHLGRGLLVRTIVALFLGIMFIAGEKEFIYFVF